MGERGKKLTSLWGEDVGCIMYRREGVGAMMGKGEEISTRVQSWIE